MKGGSGLSTKGALREVAAQQQQLQLNLNTAAAAGSPSARGGSPSARAGGGGAAAGRTDLAAMMAGAAVSARRQSIVKRDGTVDAAPLAADLDVVPRLAELAAPRQRRGRPAGCRRRLGDPQQRAGVDEQHLGAQREVESAPLHARGHRGHRVRRSL